MRAILPLKDLVAAKSRLGGMLTPAERRSLMQAMVEDVLGVLAGHDQVESITVVSDDPGAAHLCVAYAADNLDERSLGCTGLNPVPAPSSGGVVLAIHYLANSSAKVQRVAGRGFLFKAREGG